MAMLLASWPGAFRGEIAADDHFAACDAGFGILAADLRRADGLAVHGDVDVVFPIGDWRLSWWPRQFLRALIGQLEHYDVVADAGAVDGLVFGRGALHFVALQDHIAVIVQELELGSGTQGLDRLFRVAHRGGSPPSPGLSPTW